MFYIVEDDWFFEICVIFFIFDEDNIEGLCGNLNDNMIDDFII